jgi:phage anti-repressor protein
MSAIAITTRVIGSGQVQTANAREIHEELEVKKDFSDWIKAQIKRADLTENEDFLTVPQKGAGGKFDSIEYHLTIEAGKHIAMMSGTPKGKVVRRYFIECERLAKQAQPLSPVSLSRMQLIELAMQAEQERLESDAKRLLLEVEVSDLKPKAQALDILSAGEDAVTITQAAKLLGIKRDRLTTWLHVNCWVYRQNGCWVAYETQIRSGRLAFKEARFTDGKTGQPRFAPYCHVTPKGLTLLAEKLARQLSATESP